MDKQTCKLKHSSDSSNALGKMTWTEGMDLMFNQMTVCMRDYIDYQNAIVSNAYSQQMATANYNRSNNFCSKESDSNALNMLNENVNSINQYNSKLKETLQNYSSNKKVVQKTDLLALIVSEIKKYMNENSTLKIMLYAKDSWKNYMIESGLDQPEAQYGCPIANTYTKQDVVELLDGYEVLSIEQDHIFPYQVEPYKRGEYVKQSWFESMPPEMFRTLEKNLGWHLLITAKLK